MRSEFQDVFKDAYDHWIDDACSQRHHASKSLALQVWQHQQSKVDELQKRVDTVKGLAQTLWEKSEEKHQQGKVWESKTLGECADEILDVLEQALKGDQ